MKDWVPPIMLRTAKRLLGDGMRFDSGFASWAEAAAQSSGYAAANILEQVLAATKQVQAGEAAYERDGLTFAEPDYNWPVVAALLRQAAHGGALNVLDFGGALGSKYFQYRPLLADLPGLRWNVVEQAHYVEAGRAEVQNDTLHFYHTIAECLGETQPNAIVLGGVLQYLEQPLAVLEEVDAAGAQALIIERTPFHAGADHHVAIQHVDPSIYKASYPLWVFSRASLLDRLATNWRLLARFDALEGEHMAKGGLPLEFEGLILEARSSGDSEAAAG